MKTRTYLAGVMGATSALALVSAAPASAHDSPAPSTLHYGRSVTQAAVLSSFVDARLDRLEAWATSLQARTAALPDRAVLTGRSRAVAEHQLLAARRANAFLATVTGLTSSQQARVDAVRATLTAASAGLRALLANVPAAAAPVKVVRTSLRTVQAADVAGTGVARHDGDRSRGDADCIAARDEGRDRDRDRDDNRAGYRHHHRGSRG